MNIKEKIFLIIMLSSISFTALAQKGYAISAGSLPGVSGLQDAHLTDRLVSGEGSSSEQVFMDYSDSNSGLFNPAIFFSMPAKLSFSGIQISNDYFKPMWEFGFGFGAATVFQLNLKADFEVWRQDASTYATVTPLFGMGVASQDMGEVPQFPGQINTKEGDFSPGSAITMSSTGLVFGLKAGINHDLGGLSTFANLGFQFALAHSTSVSIESTELEGQIHAKNCSGQSSLDLECSNYFDPFEDARGLTGLTIQIGANF
ncbi:MAG: hypothetical protein OEZ58_01440 [Gammaproteobacteria bacterium]|nr:hypothetical protein [Gammaproteobacteria bacterium]MDH5727640.1 hypothetical protein [Gammaproteobacteria bacterium]